VLRGIKQVNALRAALGGGYSPRARPWALLVAGALGLFACLAAVPLARGENVAVVVDEGRAGYAEMVEAMRLVFDEQAPRRFKVRKIAARTLFDKVSDIFRTDFYDVIVTVGMPAADVVSQLEANPPVLHTMLPRTDYERLPQQRSGKGRSAIFLDQPLARQLELIRLVLPQKSKLGVLYGPRSNMHAEELEQLARARGIVLVAATLKRAEDLGVALKDVLARTDCFLALPDPELFNRTTASSVLRSSYHARSPLIAFSPAYVKAGALAAVFSTPQQVGRQTAEILIAGGAQREPSLPEPQYPKYWTIEVNRGVARALGLAPAADSELQELLADRSRGVL
jgi:putative tryptophan/tyrosine transport system substrate-binding protein